MKRVFYLYMAVMAVALLGSCTKSFKDLNVDPNQYLKATPEATLQVAFKTTMDLYSSKFIEVSHQIYNARIGGRYDVSDATLGNIWQNSYVTVLENLKQLITTYSSDTSFGNRVQIARIWQSYVYSVLVSNYGPIPVTQANDPNHLTSVLFDSEDSVFATVLANLKDAAAKINVSKDKLTYDVIYGGDLLKWKKFANTLRLRIALRCMRNLGSVATTAVSEVMADEANTISSEVETAKIGYENVSGNENPFWRNEIKINPVDLPKLSDYLEVFFRSYNDPRMVVWFDSTAVASRAIIQDTLASTADDSLRVVNYPVPFFGAPKANGILTEWNLPAPVPTGTPGTTANAAYSNISAAIFGTGSSSGAQAARSEIILGYSEAQFLKAEAASLGLGGSKTADVYYYSGIDANFAYWASYTGISTAAAAAINSTARDAYKAVPGIKWGTAGTGFNNYLGIVNTSIPLADINKIWVQEWLAFFPGQGFDFWALQRRTQALMLPPHTNPTASFNGRYEDVPLRSSYPSSVSSTNPSGYSDALAKLSINSSSDESFNTYVALRYEKPFTPINWTTVPAFYDLRYLRKWYGTTIESLRAAAQSAGFANKVTLVSTFHP